MQSCYLIILILVFWFQSVYSNQNAKLDKNYSDRLTETNNQQSSLQQNGQANHAANVISTSNRFIASATDSSVDLPTIHQHLAANKHYENSRFRRSNGDDDDDSSSSSSSSVETGPSLNSGIMPEDNDNDTKKPINFLRLYFCGPGYQNCIYDRRLNNIQVRNEFLKQIPHMAEATLPTNYMDWKWKQMNSPLLSTKGRRDHGIATEEPHYLLVRNDDASPHHLALMSGPDFMDNPSVPQRGRRQTKIAQSYDDPFYPMRGRRADAQAWDDPFFPMRGRRAEAQAWDDPFFPMRGRRAEAKAWDDPFIPMRGRRADKKTNAWDDPFVPMRGRRAITDTYDDPFMPMRGRRTVKDGGKRSKTLPWDDPFVPMRGRRMSAKSLSYDDPFIPMRGRKDDEYDDTFIPMRGRRSVDQNANKSKNTAKVNKELQRRKRNLLASTGTFNAIYTPTEEVIVKLNNDHNNNKIPYALPLLPSNHLHNGNEHKTKVNQLTEDTTSHAATLNANHHHHQQQQHQKKSTYFLPNDFATNPDDDSDNGLMNDYGTDYYMDAAQRMHNNKMHENKQRQQQQRWMKSSRDLSQNRDAGNLARGSETSLLF